MICGDLIWSVMGILEIPSKGYKMICNDISHGNTGIPLYDGLSWHDKTKMFAFSMRITRLNVAFSGFTTNNSDLRNVAPPRRIIAPSPSTGEIETIFTSEHILCIPIWVWINTYENTIFRGMNIHKSQLFWCELQGHKVLTHCHISNLFNLSTRFCECTWSIDV